MAVAALRYGGLISGHADGSEPHLKLFTEKGAVREVPLTRSDLIRIIKSAASTLEVLDRADHRKAQS